MKLKSIFSYLAIAATFVLVWFLFIKTYDYQINFDLKTSPGTVYRNILNLGSLDRTKTAKNMKILKSIPYKTITQQVDSHDSILVYNWNLKSVNDSVTRVSVNILDKKNSLKQRFLILFGASDFVKNSISKIKDFQLSFLDLLKTFKVNIVGKVESPNYKSIIYITFKTSLAGKAQGMMRNIFFLMEYMRLNHIKKSGNPFIKITDWNIKTDSIACNFGFPVEPQKYFPPDKRVKIETDMPKQFAIKAVFHGNYKNSDNAWLALLNYAERHHLKVETKPLEVYLNDPHFYEKEIKWKANIYLPIIK